jgi:hypothetical protein
MAKNYKDAGVDIEAVMKQSKELTAVAVPGDRVFWGAGRFWAVFSV